ncbi:pentapeptide repeat-containing protein [Azotobacter vinelandii]
MKTYTAAELAEIIAQHRKWLDDEEGGEQANLDGANLREANLRGANLRGAYLRGANLGEADLDGANLREANLRGANLGGAYLRRAYLREANLGGANLREANLDGAYLGGAYLRAADLREVASLCGASGNLSEVKAIQCDLWPVTYTATHMQIGCQLHAIADWWAFGDETIDRMDSRALDWWRIWKPILQTIVETSPAVPGATKEPAEESAAA